MMKVKWTKSIYILSIQQHCIIKKLLIKSWNKKEVESSTDWEFGKNKTYLRMIFNKYAIRLRSKNNQKLCIHKLGDMYTGNDIAAKEVICHQIVFSYVKLTYFYTIFRFLFISSFFYFVIENDKNSHIMRSQLFLLYVYFVDII